MKLICRLTFIGISSLILLAAAPSTLAVDESILIASLSSSNEDTVVTSMAQLKKGYLHSPDAILAVKKLLTDSRLKVKERAAGWLGIAKADVSAEDVKAVCTLLKEPSADSNTEGLKALRGLQGSAVARAVPEVLPFLKNANTHVMRDACRTLAVIGNKDIIPQIEPLLTNPDKTVRKDAQDAITALRSKS